jgi:hypothetical protein
MILWGDAMPFTRLPDGKYVGTVEDGTICEIFGDSGDLNRREMKIGAHTLFIYSIMLITHGHIQKLPNIVDAEQFFFVFDVFAYFCSASAGVST